ncbi:uncharacterized protein L969DRAFT_43917 [Mixia osmundae IAM 14324]|uniref:BHLH domain-containing protein n=1 Tax=Mixia osmundae (strain CBS 9802 / IAM 14324 / JCM 22182 / KY 12970) TaxID=764103 RepID=G7E3S3_MIXOS|nr:uncharacterized protein L969DRAFT_43917 [Mixia osmundae IAM 14324]KEI41929.1 hypothetical protein L969DRAFT_43917 [Mixia osmundae IAM 14324]GAA97483.1 hypothetical protein E5Q_04161 [Mixia osmundae IAM 14324]
MQRPPELHEWQLPPNGSSDGRRQLVDAFATLSNEAAASRASLAKGRQLSITPVSHDHYMASHITPKAEGPPLMPMPVAYEDFQYSLPDLPMDQDLPNDSAFLLGSSAEFDMSLLDASYRDGLPRDMPLGLPPTSFGGQAPQGKPSDLFDPSEKALFSDFLHSLEVNQDFLFNPDLPPDLPKLDDPSGLPGSQEGTQLGEEIERLHLRHKPSTELPRSASLKDLSARPVDATRVKKYRRTDHAEGGMDIEDEQKPRIPCSPAKTRVRRPSLRSQTSSTETARPTGPYWRPNAALARIRAPSTDASPSRSAGQTEASLKKANGSIVSEQKRRTLIRGGFKELVEMLQAAESVSGLSIGSAEPDANLANLTADERKARKAKSKGRGRGRKGEAGAGASKSVVLSQAVKYVLWVSEGNRALEEEVRRIESTAGLY